MSEQQGLTQAQLDEMANQLGQHFARIPMKDREKRWRIFIARVWQAAGTDRKRKK